MDWFLFLSNEPIFKKITCLHRGGPDLLDLRSEKETDFMLENAIAVMAVDNLPCELPRDASVGFGEAFSKYVIPSFFNNDKDGVLERARMTQNGKLTERYAYLQDYVDGKE